ncbi:MAG: 2-oxoglutarate dehydrogenase E1 subunit family protein, partial [Ignavibacteria bacterium]
MHRSITNSESRSTMMSMNSAYVDELYFEYLKDPSSVSADWQTFFASYTPENPPQNGVSAPPVAAPAP